MSFKCSLRRTEFKIFDIFVPVREQPFDSKWGWEWKYSDPQFDKKKNGHTDDKKNILNQEFPHTL